MALSITKAIIAVLFTSMLSACFLRPPPFEERQLIELKASAADTIVVIYNHGTRNPRKKERCDASYNQVPQALSSLASDRLMIYYLCSSAVEGPGAGQAGNQVYARMYEIEQLMDTLISQGIPAEHIFLAGHSKGAWASLMLMSQVNKKFNAAILFAPALANRKSSENYPWWRNEVRPRQIDRMLQAKNMDALIFAYEDDEYNRPRDLRFLTDHYPDSVRIIAYRCDYQYTHNTHLHDCRLEQTRKLIAHYIQEQIFAHNNSP